MSIPQVEPERTRQIQPENIPEELRQRPQWVVWKLEKRDDKSTKIPYLAGGVGKASTRDLMTWRTLEVAIQAYETGRYSGIGFMFCSGDKYSGVDLDKCRDPVSGEIEEWARDVISSLDSYTEVSQSGTGIHIIVEGDAPDMKRGQVEAYSMKRFFVMTGWTI